MALGFWFYPGGGPYYAVPWSNVSGWVLSATVSVSALDLAFDRDSLLARLDSCRFALDDALGFVILWGGVNAAFGNWLPVGIAGLFGTGLVVTDRFGVSAKPRWLR